MTAALLPLPGSGRPTAEYGSVRKPYTRPLPDLDAATDDEVADLAYNVMQSDADLYAVCGSGAHVRLIAELAGKLELAETAALEAMATAQVLAGCFARAYREEHALADKLRVQVAILEADLAMAQSTASELRTAAAVERCCMTATGQASAELQARWRREDAAELEALERGRRRADRAVCTTAQQVSVMR